MTELFLIKLRDIVINLEIRLHICYLLCSVSIHGFIIAKNKCALCLNIVRNGTI